MAKQRYSVKINAETYNEVKAIAEKMNFTTTNMLSAIVRQGIESIHENGFKIPLDINEKPDLNPETLLNDGENAAKKGTIYYNKWLAGLTRQEEYQIKYSLRDWRKKAEQADYENEKKRLPEIIAEHDALSLQGRAAWLPAWDKLSKNLQAELKHTHYKKWWFDSGRSDNFLKMFGDRPTESGWANHLKQQQGYDSDEQEYARQLDKVQEELKEKGIN